MTTSTTRSAPDLNDLDAQLADAVASMNRADPSEAPVHGDVPASESTPPGTELTGTVVGVTEDDVFLDFGVKTQGVLTRSQFGKKEPIKPGRRVDVVVERFDPSSGLLIVNRRGMAQRAAWTSLTVGAVVEGRVTGVIKGGLEIDLQGIRGFMPGSHADAAPMKDISVLLNQRIQCEVVELDRRARNVVVSRRKLLERQQAEAREKLRAELAAGQIRRGVVKNITDFGAFVDLGGLEGLVHVRDLSYGNVERVGDVVSPGQAIDVKVLKIDAQRDRISLGLKQAQPDPWTDVPRRYPVGTTMKVRIVRTAPFGAFAELEPGVEGLIPISEMSWARIGQPGEVVSTGDLVDAVVIRVEPQQRRLALSMKQAQPDPWDGVLDGFQEQSQAAGRVTRLADFGAFVELAPGVEGLIHISELADRRVRSCGEVVRVGQEVEARVLAVDRENHRISLSLRKDAVAADARSPSAAQQDVDSRKPPRAQKKKRRGGLASHFEW